MKQHNAHAIVAAAILAFTVVPAARAQDSTASFRYDLEQLKQGQREIKQQLQEIKRLLQTRAAVPSGPNVKDKVFDLGDNPVKGASTAKLTLVEFTDYQ